MLRRDLLKTSFLLAGSLTSASVARALHAGVSSSSAPTKAAFTPDQRKSVSLLSEMIIPTTDTPGAVEAGVPEFIEIIVGEWYRPLERDIFYEGLAALDTHCREHAGQPFHECGEEVRIAALRASEQAAAAYKPAAKGPMARLTPGDEATPFFTKIKGLVVLGYYTSEVGAKQELAYNPAPGRFEGDYDFDKVGRQWSH